MEQYRDNSLDVSRILESSSNPMTQKTIIGTTRTLNNFTGKDWCFLGLSLVSIVICIALTISRLCETSSETSDFTFGLLLLLTSVFCTYYVIHGVFKERADELAIFVISIAIVLIYCVANIISSGATPSADLIKYIRLGVISIMGPAVIVLGAILGWDYFNTNNLIIRTFHSGNPEIVSMARKYFLCSSLLKFELQMQLSMDLLVMKSGPKNLSSTEDITLMSLGIVLTFVWVTVGFLALRLEKAELSYIFYIFALFEAASIIYRLYITYQHRNDYLGVAIYASTFSCGIIALIFWVCLILSMTFAMQNFKKGLMASAYG